MQKRLNKLAKRYSDPVVHRALQQVRAVLEEAVEQDLIRQKSRAPAADAAQA